MTDQELAGEYGLTELIGRALTDETFRRRLYEDRPAAIAGYNLSVGDLAALDNIPESLLEKHRVDQRPNDASPLRINIGIGIGIQGHFSTP